VQSLFFKEQSTLHKNEGWINKFFSDNYFQRNAILFMDSTFNKIATLIKFRYGQPDEKFHSNLKQIHNALKRNTVYKNSRVKNLVNQLIGNHNYKLIIESRALLEHALDPDYTKPKKLHDLIEFDKIITTVFSIIDEIFTDHLSAADIKITDENAMHYKVKEITSVVQLQPESMNNILHNAEHYQKVAVELLHLVGNSHDHILPYILRHPSIESEGKKLILAFMPILSDITFRVHEITRSFIYFTILNYNINPKRQLGEEVSQIVSIDDSNYFMYVSTLRVYSIYDKVSNFFTLIYPISNKNTYFKSISEWIIENDTSNTRLTQTLKDILASQGYKAIDMLRQQASHGWDLAIPQMEGTVFSHDYFTLALYQSLESILLLIETIYDIYPNIIKTLLTSNNIEMDLFDDVLTKVFNEENEHMKMLQKKYKDL